MNTNLLETQLIKNAEPENKSQSENKMRSENKSQSENKSRNADMKQQLEEQLGLADIDPEWREGLELMQKACAGEEGAADKAILALANIKDKSANGSSGLSVGDQFADPVELARKALLKSIYGDVEALQTLGRRKLDEKEQELAGLNPSPLERMLAEQAAICWMHLYYCERQFAARLRIQPQSTLGFQKEEFYHKQVARAQRRFESALKTLAQVRRLQLPTMQINVADRQINVGSGQIAIGKAQVNVLANSEENILDS